MGYKANKEKKYYIYRYISPSGKSYIGRKCSHAVVQYDLDGNYIDIFPSRTDAAKAVGCTKSEINSCCVGKTKSCRGFQWRNATDILPLKIEPYQTACTARKVVS